jgi:hypothetical protein
MNNFKIDSVSEVVFKNDEWVLIQNGEKLDYKPKYLYKYYAINENSIDCLEKDYFYLSNSKDFNDPFDCNRNLILENQKELKNFDHVDSLNDNREIGIACFTEHELEPLLWSHYTNSYKGFCLKINVELFLKSQSQQLELKKVIYSENPEIISINHPFSDYYQFILKLNNWKYESEWRLIFKNPVSISNKVNFNTNCIEEITIGYRFDENSQSKEKSLISKFNQIRKERYSNIPLMMAAPHRTKLELKKTKLMDGSIEEALEVVNYRIRNLFGI